MNILTSVYSIAKTGTESNIPSNPHIPPMTVIETSTHSADSPVESPSIFGQMTLPSSCCNTMLITINQNALRGSMMKIINTPGIAPMNGPTTGMILVIAMKVDSSSAYGISKMRQAI